VFPVQGPRGKFVTIGIKYVHIGINLSPFAITESTSLYRTQMYHTQCSDTQKLSKFGTMFVCDFYMCYLRPEFVYVFFWCAHIDIPTQVLTSGSCGWLICPSHSATQSPMPRHSGQNTQAPITFHSLWLLRIHLMTSPLSIRVGSR